MDYMHHCPLDFPHGFAPHFYLCALQKIPAWIDVVLLDNRLCKTCKKLRMQVPVKIACGTHTRLPAGQIPGLRRRLLYTRHTGHLDHKSRQRDADGVKLLSVDE